MEKGEHGIHTLTSDGFLDFGSPSSFYPKGCTWIDVFKIFSYYHLMSLQRAKLKNWSWQSSIPELNTKKPCTLTAKPSWLPINRSKKLNLPVSLSGKSHPKFGGNFKTASFAGFIETVRFLNCALVPSLACCSGSCDYTRKLEISMIENVIMSVTKWKWFFISIFQYQ